MYTTKSKVENYLNKSILQDLTDSINWVTQYIDNYTGTTFGATASIKYYDGNGEGRLIIDDYTSITSVEFLEADLSGTQDTLTSDDWIEYPLNSTTHNELRLSPYNGSFSNFPVGSKRIKVTGNFGVGSTVPADIEWVATKMVSEIYSNKDTGIKSETLGEYSVTFDGTVDEKMLNILNNYRCPVL